MTTKIKGYKKPLSVLTIDEFKEYNVYCMCSNCRESWYEIQTLYGPRLVNGPYMYDSCSKCDLREDNGQDSG